MAADGVLTVLGAENVASTDAPTTAKSRGECDCGSSLLQVSGEFVIEELGGGSCDEESNSECSLDFHLTFLYLVSNYKRITNYNIMNLRSILFAFIFI